MTAMKTNRTILRTLAAIPPAAFLFLSPALAFGADEQPDWWAIDNEIGRQLIAGKENLVEWAGELGASEPNTPRDALVKLDVCLRAALDDEACAAVRTLWSLGPEKVDNQLLGGAYYAVTDQYLAWDVARVLVESFAPRIHDISVDSRLIRHFREGDNKQRWTDDELIAWLDARVEAVRRYDADHKAADGPEATSAMSDQWRVRPIDFWTRLRLRYLVETGRAATMLEKLAALVRANPADAGMAAEYLSALKEARNQTGKAEPVSLDWMTGACRPTRATELQQIATLLVELEQYKIAEVFFLRAIDTKITDEEIARRAAMCQAVLPGETHRLLFEIGIREELAACLLKLRETDRSQKFMVEAADMRAKNKLPSNSYLAGTVQAASGARAIEGRIREEEKRNENDPQYWLNRADYFRGRGEAAPEEDALRRGLSLCAPAPQPQGKAPLEMRARILTNLAQLLVREKRSEEAAKMLLAELKDSAIESASSENAARFLGYEMRDSLKPGEPILWDWLARRKRWEHIEERLLWRMLEAAPRETRDDHFARAEKLALAEGADACRAATLGWILNRMGETKRSLPLLQHAVEIATDEELKQRAGFTLFESHLDLKDWRAAESMFGLAEKQLTTKEDVEWLGRIALIAAEKEAPEDAMRIFRQVANCDLRPRPLVAELAKLGLTENLRRFYSEVRTRLPSAKLAGLPD